MSLLHAHSCACNKSELDLFSLLPTQTGIESGSWVHYKPISSLTDDAPLEFVVEGSGDYYIDLAHTMLSVRVKMVPRNAGTPIDPGAGPVNNLLHSLFNQVDVYMNQKLVSSPNTAYAYQSYLEVLLNFGCDSKSSHLQTALWHADKAGAMDSGGNDNDGLKARRAYFNDGKTVDMIGHLHCAMMNQDKFLINGVEMRLKLHRSRDTFCLIDAANTSALHIVDASLIVRKVKISPSVLLSHARSLASTTVKYPITRVDVKAIAIHSGVHGETLDNVILGQLPKRIVLGFVDNQAFNGSMSLNPFNFKNYGINYLARPTI